MTSPMSLKSCQGPWYHAQLWPVAGSLWHKVEASSTASRALEAIGSSTCGPALTPPPHRENPRTCPRCSAEARRSRQNRVRMGGAGWRGCMREERHLRAYILANLPHPFELDFAYFDELPRNSAGKFED